MTIIEQLKANEKPFVLMSKEMQDAMLTIGQIEDIEQMICRANFEVDWCPMSIRVDRERCEYIEGTFRLRADYEEEPEIVEYKIKVGGCGALVYIEKCVPNDIEMAYHDPDFIGFKFEDGKILPYPIKYGDAHIQNICGLRDALGGKISHATHVLFRRTERC